MTMNYIGPVKQGSSTVHADCPSILADTHSYPAGKIRFEAAHGGQGKKQHLYQRIGAVTSPSRN